MKNHKILFIFYNGFLYRSRDFSTMADTYSQIYFQGVFAVRGRANLNPHGHKDITGIVTKEGQKLLGINGMPDHIPFLIGLKPVRSLLDLVRELKVNSFRFINEIRWQAAKFEWQKGFGAFSYGHSQLTRILNYIKNQEIHHRRSSFIEENTQFPLIFPLILNIYLHKIK